MATQKPRRRGRPDANADGKTTSPLARARRWRLVVVLLLILAGLVVAGIEVRSRLDGWIRGALVREVAKRLGGRLSFGEFRLRVNRFEVEFTEADLDLPGDGGDGLSVEIERGRLRLVGSSLLGLTAGRLRLAELELDGPTVAWDRTGLSDSKDAGARRRPVELRVGHLVVRNGRWRFTDREVPWDLTASEVDLEGSWDRRRSAIVGRVGMHVETTRPPLVHPLPLSVEARFRLRRHDVELEQVEAAGRGLRGTMSANVRFTDPISVVGRGRGEVEVGVLRELLAPELPSMQGTLAGSFSVESGMGPLLVRGEIEATRPRLDRFSAERAKASVRYTPGELELVGLEARALDGEITGALRLGWYEGMRFDTSLVATGVDLDALLEQVEMELPLAGRVNGKLSLAGDPASRRSWSGSGSFDVVPSAASRGLVPLGGRGEFRIDDGALDADGSLDAASATMTARAEVDLVDPGSGGFEVEGHTLNARNTQLAVLTLGDALKLEIPDALRQRVGGAGPFQVSFRLGTDPETDLALELAHGRFGRHPFDRAELELSRRSDVLRVPYFELRHGEELLNGSLLGRLDPLSLEEIEVEARSLDPARLLAAAGLSLDLTGRLDADLSMREGESGREGSGRVELSDGTLFDEPFDRLSADLLIESDTVHAVDLDVAGPSAEAHGSAAWWIEDRRFSLTLARALVKLGALTALEPHAIDGRLELSGQVSWLEDEIDGELRLVGHDWSYRGELVGPARGNARFETDGLVAWVDGGEETDWAADVWLGWDPDLPVRGRVALERTLFELGDAAPSPVWARVSGDVTLDGPLKRPAEMRLQGRLTHAEIYSGVERIETSGPVELELDEGRLAWSPIRLVGPDTELTVEGRLDVAAGRLDAEATGRLGLGLLTSPWPELRANGDVEVSIRVTGPPAEPLVTGSLACDEGRVRWLGLGQSVDRLSFRIELEGQQATLHELEGRFGNGELRAEGEAVLDGLGLDSYALRLDGANVQVSYPEGMRGVYEGQVALQRAAQRTTLSGNVTMLLGAYEKNFDWTGQGGRSYVAPAELHLPANVFLDIQVLADGDVWVRNDLAKVESSFDIHVGGTIRRPEITGRLWMLEGGKVVYRDVEYRLVSGSLDFVELERLNPYITIRAETTVKDYTVFLRVEGTLERYEYELTSDPALATQDIIALLTTGNTLEEITGTTTGGTPFTGDLAANYFGGALTAPFTKQLQRLTGLERVRIDPFLTDGESDPTTRLTLGKEVAEDLFVIFSTDLSRNERQLYQVEWQATRRFRLGIERDTQGGVGGDVRYTKRFWFDKPPLLADAPRGQGVDSAPVVASGATVASVTIEGDDEADPAELYRQVELRTDDPFSRSGMFAGVEALKRHYLRRDRLECRVDATAETTPVGVAVRYRITPGPAVDLEFRGTRKKEERRLRERLRQLWIDSVFTEEVYDDAADRIRDFFHDRGHYVVDVSHEIAEGDGRRRVTFVVDRGQPVKIERVVILGAEALSEQRIREAMTTRRSSTFSRRVLVPRQLESDLKAIRGLYRNEGFLDARVSKPRVQLSIEGTSAVIELEIEEGIRSTVSAVDYPENLPFSEEQLAGWAAFGVGEVFSPQALLLAESRLRAAIDLQGFPDARVGGSFVPESDGVRVAFAVDPGTPKRITEVRIVGNRLTQEKVIRRELELEAGDVLSREKLLRSQHQLYQLGIFREVRLSYAQSDPADPTAQTLEVAVSEAPPATTSVGVGYDTEADARFSFSLGHDNVGGYDRALSVQGKISGLERRLQVVGREPRLFNHRLTGLVSLGWGEEEQNDFTEERLSTAFRVAKRLNPKWASYVRYSLQDVVLSDVTISPEELEAEKLVDGRLADFGIGFVRDTRDNPFLTRKGTYLTIGSRLFARALGSEFTFVRNDLNWSVVIPAGHGTQLASAVRVGVAFPYGPEGAVPISEAYFAGGDSTLRGFPRDEVGPASGGESMLLLNEELRFPVWGALKGVVFYDLGNVYVDVSDFDPSDLRHVLGTGLRLETPIGPLRIEYGGKLDRQPGESIGELFFSIGSAF